MKNPILFFFISFFLSLSTLKAQKELSLNFQKPLFLSRKLVHTFYENPGIMVSCDNLLFDELSLNLGYYSFKPQKDIFYYVYNGNETGSLKFSNYSIFQLSASYSKKFEFKEKINVLLGLDFGYYYIFYTKEEDNNYINSSETNIDGKGLIGPYAGLQYMIDEKWGVQLKSRYELLFAIGSPNPNHKSYNPNAGEVIHFISNSLGVTYLF